MKSYILSALVLVFLLPASAQKSKVKVHSINDDSPDCGPLISSYRTFYNLKLYKDAYPTWLIAFNNCADSSEMMYVDGVVMYRSFIESATDEQTREGLIDTLMLIYDRRMAEFGGEGNVLGRKGKDLLKYRRSDVEQVQEAYSMLRKSIELEGKKSREIIMLNFISAGVKLYGAERLDNNQLIDDYSLVVGIIDQLEDRSFRLERTWAKINEILRKENILSCEALDQYYITHFEENKNNSVFLGKLISTYSSADCEQSDFYVAALEYRFSIDPGSESAHDLALMFIAKDDLQKAAYYLKEAVQGDSVDSDIRAEWYYELALVSNANRSYCEAIDYAREAIALKEGYARAYMLLGDAFILSREDLSDEVQGRAAFWAAADMYAKADSLDPSLEEEARQKLSDCALQYPSQEDIFFLDMRDGDPYRVEGCINVNTTVRSRK